MAQRLFPDGGPQGRSGELPKEGVTSPCVQGCMSPQSEPSPRPLPVSSVAVLGTLAVRIERDPRTGNTTVTSVTPVPTAGGAAPTATTLFDDGRKSIHAVGAHGGGPPSTEELGQILSAIDGIGMEMVLDGVPVSPGRAEAKPEQRASDRVAQGKGLPCVTPPELASASPELASASPGTEHLDSCTGSSSDPQPARVSCASRTDRKADQGEGRSILTLEDIARETGGTQVQSLEQEPVTLVFMGYRDSVAEDDHDEQAEERMLTAERVIITDDGEEYVLGGETGPGAEREAEAPASLDLGPGENGTAGEEGAEAPCGSASPQSGEPRRDGTTKCAKCHCCVVM